MEVTAESGETSVAADTHTTTDATTTGRTIAVYLSAGPSTAAGAGATGPSCATAGDCGAGQACDQAQTPARCVTPSDAWSRACNADNVQSCKLYRVEVDLDTGAVRGAALVFDPATDIQPANANATFLFPALSPTDDRVALEYRTGRSAGEIKVCQLAPGGAGLGTCGTVSLGTTNNRGRWPNWRDAQTLDFALQRSGAGTAWSDVYQVALDPDEATPTAMGDATTLLGAAGTPAGVDTSQFAFEDGFAFTRAGVHYVASHGNWPAAPPCRDATGAVASPANCVFRPSSVPSVWDVDHGVGYPVDLTMSQIGTPWACAHVGVSPDGTRLACTVQETYADAANVAPAYRYGEPYNVPVDPNHDGVSDGVVRQYPTFEFGLDEASGTYVSTTGREMFAHSGPAALEALDARFDQTACGSATHSTWLHKFTEYCGDDTHLVTTVFCSGPTVLGDGTADLPTKVVYSAVYLIDISDRAHPIYTSLTGAVETWIGTQGTPVELMSVAGTCGHLKPGP